MDSGSAMVEEARERLRAGVTPEAVCAELAARVPQWWDAALAVGLALGIEEAELLRRMDGDPDLQSAYEPGDEEAYAEFLELGGLFDVPKQLDEREEVIADHLWAAVQARGRFPSGYFFTLQRGLLKGELAHVFRSLTRTGLDPDRSRPAEFWAALSAAGELLDPADGDECGTVAQALDECRQQLADCTG